jgi:hypothetical protein
MDIICNICNTKISNKRDIIKHQKTEKCQNVKRFNTLINKNNQYEIEINKQQEIIKNLNNNIENLNLNFQNELDKKDNMILTLENKIKSLEEKSEEYRKIVEKAATKSTKIVNNNNNNKNTYNHNNYLNYISKEPLKFSELQQKISNLVTTKTIMFNNDDFNDHITKNMLRDENGKDKILCTDINRKNFTYKDEKSGKLISDPELERLREQLIKGSSSKLIKKDLLDKLIKKYEGTSIDPYSKFYEYLQNIQFGIPFVEHVAKKTYIKTKPDSTTESNEILPKSDLNEIDEDDESSSFDTNTSIIISDDISIDDISDINIDNIDDFEYINKLYNKMKEFDNE